MNEKQPEAPPKTPRDRSPNFPSIDLKIAVSRAKEIYAKDGKHEVPITVIHERWKLSKMTGAVTQIVAALAAYGLVKTTGSGEKRKIRLTDTGRKIVADHSERQKLLEAAALQPGIFNELWSSYGPKLPPDDTIREYLVFDREGTKFNESSADKAIDRFRKSIDFGKPSECDKANPECDEDAEEVPLAVNESTLTTPKADMSGSPTSMPPLAPPQSGFRREISALDEGEVILQFPEPLGKASVEDLDAWLEYIVRKLKRRAGIPEGDG